MALGEHLPSSVPLPVDRVGVLYHEDSRQQTVDPLSPESTASGISTAGSAVSSSSAFPTSALDVERPDNHEEDSLPLVPQDAHSISPKKPLRMTNGTPALDNTHEESDHEQVELLVEHHGQRKSIVSMEAVQDHDSLFQGTQALPDLPPSTGTTSPLNPPKTFSELDIAAAAANIVGHNHALLTALLDSDFSKQPQNHGIVLSSNAPSPQLQPLIQTEADPEVPVQQDFLLTEQEEDTSTAEATARVIAGEALIRKRLLALSQRLSRTRERHANLRLEECRSSNPACLDHPINNPATSLTSNWLRNLRNAAPTSFADLQSIDAVDSHLKMLKSDIDPYDTDSSLSSPEEDNPLDSYELAGLKRKRFHIQDKFDDERVEIAQRWRWLESQVANTAAAIQKCTAFIKESAPVNNYDDTTLSKARPFHSESFRRATIQKEFSITKTTTQAPFTPPLPPSHHMHLRARSLQTDPSFHSVLSTVADSNATLLKKAQSHRRYLRKTYSANTGKQYRSCSSPSLPTTPGSSFNSSVFFKSLASDGDDYKGKTPHRLSRLSGYSASPTSVAGSPLISPLQGRKRASVAMDLDFLLIPTEFAPSRIEPLEHRDILTPSWKSAHETEQKPIETTLAAPEPVRDIEEDTSDQAFSRRHYPLEISERRRFLQYFSAGLRRRNNSNTAASPTQQQSQQQSSQQSFDATPSQPSMTTCTVADPPLLSALSSPTQQSSSLTTVDGKRPKVILSESDLPDMYQKIYQWVKNPNVVAPFPPRSFPLSLAQLAVMLQEDQSSLTTIPE